MSTGEVVINNSSDVAIVCGRCGCSFNGQANYSDKVAEMFIRHWEDLHA